MATIFSTVGPRFAGPQKLRIKRPACTEHPYLYLDAWQDVIKKLSDEEAKRLSLAARYIIATYD
jgi:hypothetical protein